MSITERMKKYAEVTDGYLPSIHESTMEKCAMMFSDLQATMRALKAAREAMSYTINRLHWHYDENADENDCSPRDAHAYDNGLVIRKAHATMKTIDDILGDRP